MPREAALRLGRKHVPSGYPRLNSLSTATAKLAGPLHPPRRARAWVRSLSSRSPPACTDTWPHREATRPPASERQSFCPPTPHASETLGEDSVPWSPLLLPNPCLHEAHAYGHSPATLPAAVTYHRPSVPCCLRRVAGSPSPLHAHSSHILMTIRGHKHCTHVGPSPWALRPCACSAPSGFLHSASNTSSRHTLSLYSLLPQSPFHALPLTTTYRPPSKRILTFPTQPCNCVRTDDPLQPSTSCPA